MNEEEFTTNFSNTVEQEPDPVYTKPLSLEQLNYSPAELGTLLKEHSLNKKNNTVEITHPELGLGRLVINNQLEGNQLDRVRFYPDQANKSAHQEDMKRFNRAQTFFNAPMILAPFIGIAKGGKKIYSKYQDNKAWMQPQVKGAVPLIDQPLTAPQWQTFFATNSKTGSIIHQLARASGVVPPTPKVSTSNLYVQAQSQVKVDPYQTSIESFAQKAATATSLGETPNITQTLAESGLVQFIRPGSSTGIALEKLSGSQIKTNKQTFFTEIYDPEWAARKIINPKEPIPDMFAYTGSAHPTGIMTAQKRNPVLPEILQKKFNRKYAGFPGFQMSPHHFTLDDDLGFSVISKINKLNQPKVVDILNKKFDIYPGNHPKNFIMSYHDNTKYAWNQTKAQINELWKGIDGAPTDSEINKFLKMPAEGVSIGKGSTLLEEVNMMVAARKKGMENRDWSQILPPGKTINDIKLDPVVLGIDHQTLIHGIGDKLPSRIKLLELSKTAKWSQMSPLEQAIEIAKVSRQQQNLSLRISGIRLDLIKKRMKELNLPINDWTDIQVWMIQNPSEAASLDWHKLLSKGTGYTVEELIQDVPKARAQEIANVFNLEAVPNTGQALDNLLNKKPAKRSELKAVELEIKKKGRR